MISLEAAVGYGRTLRAISPGAGFLEAIEITRGPGSFLASPVSHDRGVRANLRIDSLIFPVLVAFHPKIAQRGAKAYPGTSNPVVLSA